MEKIIERLFKILKNPNFWPNHSEDNINSTLQVFQITKTKKSDKEIEIAVNLAYTDDSSAGMNIKISVVEGEPRANIL